MMMQSKRGIIGSHGSQSDDNDELESINQSRMSVRQDSDSQEKYLVSRENLDFREEDGCFMSSCSGRLMKKRRPKKNY